MARVRACVRTQRAVRPLCRGELGRKLMWRRMYCTVPSGELIGPSHNGCSSDAEPTPSEPDRFDSHSQTRQLVCV